MGGDYSQLYSFLTGSGTGGVIAFFWIKSLIRQNENLQKDLKDERQRNNEYGEAIIAIAAESKIHFSLAAKSNEGVIEAVREEGQKTREAISTAKHEGTG